MGHNHAILKKAILGLFTVSTFYKDVTQTWTNSINEEKEINHEQMEEIMKITEEFVESKDYNTDPLEKCINKNEEFFDKHNYDLK